ncbi:sensor domain-containing diguanylate cyclase [Hydrocarboniclastica marina]|uniref:Diguanylate cyclase n=1 Tax=Hydrocarboniclastica marina TaxID=2259620 RepID=A0A4P7XED9_9ALTE|nr:sensor domain-containing diguanylate cyclase [Hydrocarboniclastica marina]QCF24903.1 diguanylate cyclase [Hydrocarboniclastica marina]
MSEFTKSEIDSALAGCAREPVHTPGAIQPNGCLISADIALQRVLQVSANIDEVLGVSPSTALAGTADHLLGSDLADRLRSMSADGEAASQGSIRVRRTVDSVNRRFSVRHYRSANRTVVELELDDPSPDEDLIPNRNSWLQPVNTAETPQQLLERLTHTVMQLTGYDRVMVYRFDDDNHGSVVAESRSQEADSYLGHHFPASDIPAQVRDLYSINPVRCIPDATAPAVGLLPPEDPLDGTPLDLSLGNLRAVSPVHLLYLRNMGVEAAASFAMHDEGNLWGLVACHNLTAKKLSPGTRDDIAVLVQVATSRLLLLQARLNSRYRQQIRDSRELFLVRQEGKLPTPDSFLQRFGADWLTLFSANGLALLYRGKHYRYGTVPDTTKLDGIANTLSRIQVRNYWHTHQMGQSELADYYAGNDTSGLLAIRLPVSGNAACWLFLFRPGQTMTRTWAGRPEDNSARSPTGKLILTPRSSFSAWTEIMEGISEPWVEIQRRAAIDLGEDLAVVLFSREVDQLNANLTAANERLRRLAQTDALTGLPNRRLLEDRVEVSLSRAHRNNRTLALLFLDLDRFKQINDTLGHRAGDKLIEGVAERLQSLVRETDTVARLGGDEFAILLDEVESPDAAGVIADKVLEVFAVPFELEGDTIDVTFSMGISRYPADGDSFRKLMHHADMAMYQAKSQGRNNYHYYSNPLGH